MLQVDLALFNEVFMHLLRVAPGPLLPVGHGALIEAEGGDNRLRRTAMHEQGQHQRDPIHRCAQAVEGGALGRSEGLATDFAVVALLLLAEDPNVACTYLA